MKNGDFSLVVAFDRMRKTKAGRDAMDELFWEMVERGRPRAVEWLLRAGVSPNISRNDGETALHMVADRRDQLPVMRVLVGNGADARARRVLTGETPIERARRRGVWTGEYIESMVLELEKRPMPPVKAVRAALEALDDRAGRMR